MPSFEHHLNSFYSSFTAFHPLIIPFPMFSLHYFTTPSLLSLLLVSPLIIPYSLPVLCRYNLMTQCWQQNPEDRPTFFSIADKLKLHHERLKCASVCIDDDLSDLEEEGELKRGDSNRSWLRGSLRDSMRRIRTSIHRTGSLRAIRRQSSFKGDSSSHPTNGQVSSGSADNLLESVSMSVIHVLTHEGHEMENYLEHMQR